MEKILNKYLNNIPKSDINNYKEEIDVLVSKIDDKDIRNIGIVAPYGAGKSSLIKTYKDENKALKRNKKKIIEISLLDLTSKTSSKQEGDDEDKNSAAKSSANDSLLEKSILEQMFFKEDKSKLPLSRIDRIHGRFWISLLKSALIILSIVSVILSILEFNHILPCSSGSLFYIFFGVSVLFVLATVTSFIVSSNIRKISIKNIEIEFTKINNGSVLNLFLDEIIYYFKKTKIDVVIFEDIDRFDSINIFTKLREINQVINDNKRINRKITFIYCVSDEFFASASDRAKFFDFMISFLPVLTPQNVADHIFDAVGNGQLSDLFIQRVSRFIHEKRILNNIVNDYYFFSKKLLQIDDDVSKNEKLFAMMTYKNLCFEDYVLLQKGEGELVGLFNTKKMELIQAYTKALKNQIAEIDKKIEESKNNVLVIKNISNLKEMIAGILAKSGSTSTSIPSGYFELDSIETFKDIKAGIYIKISSIANYYGSVSTVNSIKYMNIDTISATLQRTPFEIEQQIKGEYQEPLYQEKKQLFDKIQKISGMKLKELVSLKSTIDENNKLLMDNYLSFAVRNGYIDESYFIFVGQKNSKINSTFIDNVVSDKPQNYEQHLDNCELIIDSLNDNEFGNKYILNYSLIEYLFTHEGNLEKKSFFLNYLSSGEEETIQFVANYYSLGYESEVLITELMKKDINIVNKIINTGELTQDQIHNLTLLMFLRKGEIQIELLNKEIICNFISNFNHVLEAFLPISDKNSLIDYLSTFNVRKIINIDYMDTKNKKWEDLMIQIVDKCMFEINFVNIKIIELYYLKTNLISISSLIKCDKAISNYFKENITQTILEIVNNIDSVDEDNQIIIDVLSDSSVDITVKESFIKKFNNEIDYDARFGSEICSLLLYHNKLSKKWSNLSILHKKEGINHSDLAHFIEINNEHFQDNLVDKNLVNSIINEWIFENNHVKRKLVRYVNVSFTPDEINDDLICCDLLEHKNIEVNKENMIKCKGKIETLIAMLIHDQSLVEFLKMLVLDADELNKILENDEVLSKTKLAAIKDFKQLISSDNLNNKQLCDNVLLIINDNQSFVFDPVLMFELLSNSRLLDEKRDAIIKLCFDLYNDLETVEFFRKLQPALYEHLLKHEGFKSRVKTVEIRNNPCIDYLFKKSIISPVRKSKNHTTINVVNLIRIVENA